MKKFVLLLFLIGFYGNYLKAADYDIVVSLDGDGDYTSIQDAIDAVPDNSSSRTVIYIKDGTYDEEKLLIPEEKQNVTFLGESRDGTIISYHIYDCDDGKCPTEDAALWDDELLETSATLTINADGFIAKDLTIENTAGAVGQAQAITVSADKVIFINCDLTGYQDTIYFWTTEGRIYFKNCLVVGRTDYIYGGGIAFFDECEIRSWGGGWITAPSTSEDLDYGFVFYSCDITYATGSPRDGDDGDTVALGRPWHNYPKVTWIYCDMTEYIDPEGWPTTWNMDYADTSEELHLYEYENTGDGADMSERADWVGIRALTDDEAPDYEREVVLAGDDNWDPLDDLEDLGLDAFSTIEAEDYDNMSGVKSEDYDDGEDVGYIQNGDWIEFDDVDFGDDGAAMFTAYAATSNEGTIKIMLGDYEYGTEIGTCTISSTGSFSTYEEFSCDVDEVSGVYDVYLVFEGDDDSYLFNLDYFSFTENTVATLTKHGAGSSSQTIDLGDAITDFYYSWENATSVTVSGMPDGITTTIDTDEQTVTFSGTPTVSGEFNYTVTTTGASENATMTGTITVDSCASTITVSATPGDGSVTLNWSTLNIDIRNIQIMRDTDSDSYGRTRIGTAGSDETSYTDSDVTNETTYYYWVKIVDIDLNSYNSGVVGATPSDDSDGTITFSATPGDGYVVLQWSTTDIDIRNIQIYRDTDADASGRTRIATPDADETSYTDSDVTNDTTYYYWVKIVDTDLSTHNSGVVESTPEEVSSSTSSSEFRLMENEVISDESSAITAYPNPVKEILYIKNGSGKVSLYDMVGGVIYNAVIDSDLYEIDMSSYPKGVYLLIVKGENNTLKQTVVKK